MLWSRGPDRSGGDGKNVLPDGSTVHLALYKYDTCPYCRRVFGAIDELGAHIEYRDVHQSAEWRKDLLSKTGGTQVPCLLIDGEPMLESLDIIRWLRQRFAAP
jgi:glutaredoxin 3